MTTISPDRIVPSAAYAGLATPRLTVDLDALRANYRAVKAAAGGVATGAAVKASGYGLGAERVVQALIAEGCGSFFVANGAEGVALRRLFSPSEAEIFVLNGVLAGEETVFIDHALSPVLNTAEQVRRWSGLSEDKPGGALHVDTGMNRLGLSPAEFSDLIATPAVLRAAKITVFMSHLACAAAPDHPQNAKQLAEFTAAARWVRTTLPDIRLSLANSAGAFLGAEYAFDLVRPGIALYGGAPFDTGGPTLAPVATLHAPVLQTRSVPAGGAIGYGASVIVDKPTRTATVALGYADGFLRAGAAGGYGWVAGARAPILGRISMDLITLDLSGVAAPVAAGDLVEFLGPNASIDEQADAARTISYEFLTRLGPRCTLDYVGASPGARS